MHETMFKYLHQIVTIVIVITILISYHGAKGICDKLRYIFGTKSLCFDGFGVIHFATIDELHHQDPGT